MKLTLIPIIALLLCGWGPCQSVPAPGSTESSRAPVVNAIDVAKITEATSMAARDKRLSEVRANVDAIIAAPHIEQAPVAQNEAIVAQGRLAGVQPDPAEVAAAAERRALVESGRAAEARANAEASAAQGRTDAARIIELEAASKADRARADAVSIAFTEQAVKNQIASQRAIDRAVAAEKRAREDADNQVRADQIAWCNKIGFGALGLAVALIAGAWFLGGGLLGLQKLGPVAALIAVVGFGALGLARFLGSRWFMPSVTILVLGILTWVTVWMLRHRRRGDLAEELKRRSDKFAAVAKDVVPIVDEAYENGKETVDALAARLKAMKADGIATVRDVLDDLLFSKLSSRMDKETKQAVKEIRSTT